MLGKLLKYDLKNTFKFLSIFYILAIIFSILTRVFLNIENSMVALVIGEIFKGAAISMMFSTLINNLMRFWVKFRQNLYLDEAYLTHTLPIKKKTLYLSKFITGLITLFVSMLIILSSFLILFYTKELYETFNAFVLSFDISVPLFVLLFFIILFLQFYNILQTGLIGIVLGHKKNSAKIGFSVLFGFIVYTVTQFLILLSAFIAGIFKNEIMDMFVSSAMPGIATIKTVIIICIAAYAIVITAGCLLNIKFLKKGVNID